MALTALDIVQRYYPGVTKVKDARKGVNITVTKADSFKGTKKAPNRCAMANAFCRKEGCDGAIISKSISYLIQGEVATRYKTPVSVAHEIVSFDRGHDFDPGEYNLRAPGESERLGNRAGGVGSQTTRRSSGNLKNRYHKTAGVRAL